MSTSDELDTTKFHQFEIFDGLNVHQVAEISECSDRRSVDAGEEIMREGGRSRDLFGLISGRVEVVKMDGSGSEQRLAEIGTGHVFGELGLAVGAPRTATVRTLEDSEFLVIDGEEFHQLQQEYSNAAYKVEHNILRLVARRMGETNRELLEGMTDDS
jgi:SulP family sulfate permease